MVKVLVSDFSRVLLFPRDATYEGGLNKLHADLADRQEKYDILEHFELNKELFDFYRTFKDRYRLVVFTTGVIQNAPPLRKEIDAVFEKVYAANELGWSKKEPRAYQFLAESLGVLPAEIMYVDDNSGNIAAATAAGCQAIPYGSNAQAIKEISELLA